MNKVTVLSIIVLSFLLCGRESYSQFRNFQGEKTQPVKHYWGDVDGFLNRQAEVTLELVKVALDRFPPAVPEPFERRMALLMIDGVLHDPAASERLAVQKFYHARMERFLRGLKADRVERGAMIWKLYNHGFVVRTPVVTIAFDLVRGNSAGAESFAIPAALVKQIVQHCDVLFISHGHGDHADEGVAQAFIELGKTVVAPPEVWTGRPIHKKITHLKRDAAKKQQLAIQNGKRILEVILYPGHQGERIPNNVPLIFTPEGLSFAHTGDQSNVEDFAWIDEVSMSQSVDVLIPNCWTNDIERMIRGFSPMLVITGHENELGHSVDHREPFWMTYDLLRESAAPYVLLTWGESYHYQRKALLWEKVENGM